MTYTFSIGQLIGAISAISGPLVAIFVWLVRIDQKMNRWMVEHEMLMLDLAKREGVDLNTLPTRSRGVWQ